MRIIGSQKIGRGAQWGDPRHFLLTVHRVRILRLMSRRRAMPWSIQGHLGS